MSTSKKQQNNQPKRNKQQKQRFHSLRQNLRHRIRRTVPEETAGGVVFRRVDGKVEIMMIQDAKNRWSIPKGKVEPGERLEQTAAREVEEETGLKCLRVMDRLGKVDFRYRSKDSLIMKTMHVFLIHAYEDSDNYQPEDHKAIKSVGWFPANKALDLIEYDDIGKLILLALKEIRQNGY